MSVVIIKGNIFTSTCQVLVNTVNCVGVMGAGIALECRLRYPDMYTRYVSLCNDKKIDVGLLWLYKSDRRWILNFPTKKHWKDPARVEYLHSGLKKFRSVYAERGIESIAFPILGASNGGLSEDESLDIMKNYLDVLDIRIEIYRYDDRAKDDLYETTKNRLMSLSVDQIASATKLRRDYVQKVIDGLESQDVFQLNQLVNIDGIGIKTLEKLFRFASEVEQSDVSDQSRLLL